MQSFLAESEAYVGTTLKATTLAILVSSPLDHNAGHQLSLSAQPPFHGGLAPS